MQYFAKVNTAGPKMGFISVGEMLTDRQVEALGEEKLAELVAVGVLEEMADDPKPVSASTDTQGDDEDAHPATGNDGDDVDEADDDNDDEALPELEIEDELVEDQPSESSANAPKKGGRRKAK